MSSKTIKFSIPDYIYNHLRAYLDTIGYKDCSVDDFFKCCATTRMINKGYLDEFGQPNELILPPTIDFSSIDFGGKLDVKQ